MPRKWKNSDDVTFFTEKAMHNRLERLRKELIPGYDRSKKQQQPTPNFKNHNRKKK